MAGAGSRFQQAGYSFPKPLIDVSGKPMIQIAIENLKPKCAYKFIFICKKEHYDNYSLREIFNNLVGQNNYEVILLNSLTQGAACTVLSATEYINNDNDLLIANSDQFVDIDINDYIKFSRESGADGTIMTFAASHPKWSYARVDKKNTVIEVAEKRVISNHATVGIYYLKQGKNFVSAANSMIEKDIRVNNEFYVCPVFNETILNNGVVKIWEMPKKNMHGLGTPEDLNSFLAKIEKKQVSI